MNYSTCFKTAKLSFLALFANILVIDAVNAQSVTYNWGGQSFSSKGAAEAAMYSVPRNQNYTEESAQGVSMTTVRYSYSAPDQPLIVEDYNSYSSGFSSAAETEQESLENSIDNYANGLARCVTQLGHQVLVSRSSWVDQAFIGTTVRYQRGTPAYKVNIQCTQFNGQVANVELNLTMYRARPVYCSEFYTFNYAEDICKLPGQLHITASLNSKNCGPGNPCIPATGDKYQTETDFSQGNMSFIRSFHTQSADQRDGLGAGWTHNYAQRISILNVSSTQGVFTAANGFQVPIRFSNEAQAFLPFDGKSGFSIKNENGSWVMQRDSNERRVFDLDGRLTQIQNNQYIEDLSYDTDGRLIEIENSYGNTLTFTYDYAGRINQLMAPSGDKYAYEYNGSNLSAIIYPDNTESRVDNPRREYHYEDSRFPKYLTGITDENGERHTSYAYDANGRAISTERSQTTNTVGQEKFELDY